MTRNLAQGKAAIEGTDWRLVNKAIRVPYRGIDKSNLD